MSTNNLYKRYARQVQLKGFGEEGQQKLAAAKVLVAGAGGLGCPVLQYLAAAGVGTIGIADHDTIALSNLHRQVLYTMDDLGLPKVERARDALKKLNPDVHYIIYHEKLDTHNTLDIIGQYDIVVDCTDNFSSRYMINDATALLQKPLVSGAVSQFEGQVAIFNCSSEEESPANYRDLFPKSPVNGEIPNCAEAGVLGVLPGIIGCMQANETIKLITGIGNPLINRLLVYNALNNQTYEAVISHRQETERLLPSDANAFKKMNYDPVCVTDAGEPEITVDELLRLSAKETISVIDIREWGEEPELDWFPHKRIPLSQLDTSRASSEEHIKVFVCQVGQRSLQVARRMLQQSQENNRVFSLKGGILQWKEQNP